MTVSNSVLVTAAACDMVPLRTCAPVWVGESSPQLFFRDLSRRRCITAGMAVREAGLAVVLACDAVTNFRLPYHTAPKAGFRGRETKRKEVATRADVAGHRTGSLLSPGYGLLGQL